MSQVTMAGSAADAGKEGRIGGLAPCKLGLHCLYNEISTLAGSEERHTLNTEGRQAYSCFQ